MKLCILCGVEKLDNEFYKNSKSLDGLYSYCKPCKRANRTKYKDSESKSNRIWRLKNPDKVAAQKRKEYKKHWHRYQRSRLLWKLNNRGRCNQLKSEYKLSKRRATIFPPHSKESLEIKYIYDICSWLNAWKIEKFHVDHIIPLHGDSVSGLHVPWNLQILPAIVNIKKGNKICQL